MYEYFEWSVKSSFMKILPSSISGGRPPTNTLREKRSVTSEPCEWGDDRAGEPIDGSASPSTYVLVSSEMWSSMREKYGLAAK